MQSSVVLVLVSFDLHCVRRVMDEKQKLFGYLEDIFKSYSWTHAQSANVRMMSE